MIEGGNKTVLFDTGTRPEILMHNIKKMGVDLSAVDAVVITHDHGDHTGGLMDVLKVNPRVELFCPASFASKYEGKLKGTATRVIPVDQPADICDGIMSTGELGTAIKEQSLLLEAADGLVVVTGCSHPGIVSILKRVKTIRNRPIHLVFGGFHLMTHSDEDMAAIIAEFRTLGVEKCGATHCTGEHQIGLFEEAFGEDYVPIGTGRILTVKK